MRDTLLHVCLRTSVCITRSLQYALCTQYGTVVGEENHHRAATAGGGDSTLFVHTFPHTSPGTSPQRTTGKQYPHLFGAKLRHLRKTHGLTQLDLSQQLALAAHAHISLLERGHSEASLDMVLQIADIFGVTTDYLLWDEIEV